MCLGICTLDMKTLGTSTVDMKTLGTSTLDMKTLGTSTADMKPSTGCVRAGSYIIGEFLMFCAALFTTVYGLGLAGTLVVRDVALPALWNFPKFDICSPAFATYSESGQPNDGCTSSEDILKKVDMALSSMDALNILVISLSVGLVVGLLQIVFISVLLHGLTAQRARLVKIFCVYYAVVIGLGAIATIVSFIGSVGIVRLC